MTNTWKFNSHTSADEVVQDQNLTGKFALVTGANGGIGYETARTLASAGAHVILACRNAKLGQEALANIRLAHPKAKVELALLDLASPASVRACVETIAQSPDIPHLDILICNAGSMSVNYVETESGVERTIAVCHLGHFILTRGLLDLLLKAPAPRVVVVSSESHKYPRKLNFDSLLNTKYKNKITSFNAYGQAKLCNALMALELQRRYGEQGLTACAVHPGNLVTSNFGNESWLTRLLFAVVSPITKTPNQGAATSVFCAIHERCEDIAGGYFSHCRPAKRSAEAANIETAKRLWEFTEQCLNP
jgi:WW domain-containing oxidoreductase